MLIINNIGLKSRLESPEDDTDRKRTVNTITSVRAKIAQWSVFLAIVASYLLVYHSAVYAAPDAGLDAGDTPDAETPGATDAGLDAGSTPDAETPGAPDARLDAGSTPDAEMPGAPDAASDAGSVTKAVTPRVRARRPDRALDESGSPSEEPSFAATAVVERPHSLGTYSRIDADDISLGGARNVPQALAMEPGLEVHESPKAGGTLEIRGFDERASLLMIEGIPIREIYDGHFDISSLPAFSLESIEMERGVTSLLYGPNTAGGIVSLRVPSKCDETVDASIYSRTRLEKPRLGGGRLGACAPISDFTLHTSAGYEISEGYILSDDYAETEDNAQFHEDGGTRDGSDYEKGSVALLAKYAPSKNKNISLFLNGIHSPRTIPPFEGSGYTRYWRFTNYDTLLAGLSGAYRPESDQLPLEWGFREVRGQLYVHLHRDEIQDYEDATYERLTTNSLAWFRASAYANETYGAAVQSVWSLNRNNQLETSLRYNLDFHRQREQPVPGDEEETDWKPWERYSSHIFSAAVEDTQFIGPVGVTAGVGASGMSLLAEEINEKSYPVEDRIVPAIEGRLVTEWQVLNEISLMAAIGHKVRYPMLKELFSNNVGGNPDLKVERALMAETGFDTSGLFAKGLEVSTRLFFNSIEDLIEKYRNDVYANVGQAVTAGTEIALKYQPVEFLELELGYRYLYAYDLEHDHPLDYRTPHRVIEGVRVLTGFGLTWALDAAYNLGQRGYYTDINSEWVEERIPDYIVFNAHIRYELLLGDIVTAYLFADGFNLFDIDYYNGSFEPRSGREVILGLGGRL
jgi:iron complex outermembrane receptor protein